MTQLRPSAMGLLACFAIGTLACPDTASAQSTAQCAPYESQTVLMDLGVATRMAASAAAAVGDTPTYAAWFGDYSLVHAEKVRAVFKAIHTKLVSERLAIVCAGKSDFTCRDAFAWVLPATGVIRLCPDYFLMPSMVRAHEGADIDYGTREGTLIHEVSHYVSYTEDECLSWTDCRTLAARSPTAAIISANSYESFAEDIMLQLLAAK